MSRIADALSKTFTTTGPGGAPEPDDQPWGDDLSIGMGSEGLPIGLLAPADPAQEFLDDAKGPPAPRRPIAHSIPPALSDLPRSADRIETPHDPHLAAMVERVFLPVSGEPARSTAFVGLGVRSSAITARAAELLARQTGSSVCVVDANFAAPSLHHHFSLPNHRGLAEAIEQGLPLSEAAREVRPNLWLLSAGAITQRPSFGSDAVRLRMAQFIARFDYVLMDIEAIPGPGEARGLAPLVAGIILVVSADATRRDAARRATEMLRGCGAAVLGAVLTERRFPIPDALYRRI